MNGHRPTVITLIIAGAFALGCGNLTGGSSDDAKVDTADPASKEGGAAIEPGTKMAPPEQSTAQKAKGIFEGVDSSLPWPGVALARNQCNAMSDGGEVKGPDCITDYIECDQTIIGHTRGGTKNFNTRWWEMNFCTPATTYHDSGDERVYKFSFPDETDWRAWFTLDTPCADLDVFVIQWDGSTCPTESTYVNECDAQIKDGTTRERAEAVSDGNWPNWLIVVEGKDGEEGAFALTAQCRKSVR